MGWSAAVRGVCLASLVGWPRGGWGRFRPPWLGGVGCPWWLAFCLCPSIRYEFKGRSGVLITKLDFGGYLL